MRVRNSQILASSVESGSYRKRQKGSARPQEAKGVYRGSSSLSSLEYQLTHESCARTRSLCDASRIIAGKPAAKLNPPARRAMRSRRVCSGLHARLLCVALTAASAQNTLKLPVEVDQSGAASSNAPRPRRGGAGSRRPRPLGLRIGDAGPCVGPPSGAA